MANILQNIKHLFKKKSYIHRITTFTEVDNPQTFDCLCIRCDKPPSCKKDGQYNLCKYCKLINLNNKGAKKYILTHCNLFKERKL